METTIENNILSLFDRPRAPLYDPKSDVNYVLPEEYKTDRYKTEEGIAHPLGASLFSTSTKSVVVKKVDIPEEELKFPLSLDRKESFSLFIPLHRKMAASLIETFMNLPSAEDLFSLSIYLKERTNPQLHQYALSVALLHRQDTKDFPLPSHSETFPDKFVDSVALNGLKEEVEYHSNPEGRLPVPVKLNVTSSDLEDESRVAYFREDLGINLHHWHWHLVNPTDGPKEIVKKDRRGELFYYMHQQLLARYAFERFSNKLPRTKPLTDLKKPLTEGYYPKLTNETSSKIWPGRSSNVILSDISRDDLKTKLKFGIDDLMLWKERILQAIHSKTVYDTEGKTIALDEEKGIDILGDLVEATDLSVNKHLYGDLHNKGHMAIAYCHDPDNRHLESFGVMGDSATAMRDPIFYRWHTAINNIFKEHKVRLPSYTKQQLIFEAISVASVEVNVEGQDKNKLVTKWKESDVNMSRGLDAQGEKVVARFTHLDHEPFTYTIQVENSGTERYGTVRIFLAPKVDDRNLAIPFLEQRDFFIEMDKFVEKLSPGTNKIVRTSKDSSVVIPFETTFRELKKETLTANEVLKLKESFCGCGWPAHMLLPKGSKEGLPCNLFVMISNYDEDKVEGCDLTKSNCKTNAASFCGLRDKNYPDKRAMGYPFDRLPLDKVETLKDFLTPNMFTTDVTIVSST